MRRALRLLGVLGAVTSCVTALGPRPVPDYVLRHAPLVHFDPDEICWPSTLEEHLRHVSSPRVDGLPAPLAPDTVGLDNLDHGALNSSNVFLSTQEDVTLLPDWFRSEYGRPDADGRSVAPAILIVVDKTHLQPGLLDAYWFLWTSGQVGPFVEALGDNMGSHTSDWEHIIVRFVDGQPTAVFLSQHGRGEAYTFDAIMKEGDRPVAFSALGTHAMRAVPGKHVIYSQYVYDYADYGPCWDMALNRLAFHYAEPDGKPSFEAAEGTDYPTAWLHSYVRWGNQRLSAKDPRQRSAVKFVKWTDGSTGPIDKQLMARAIIPHRPDAKPAGTLPETIPGRPRRVLGALGTESAAPVETARVRFEQGSEL